MSVCRADAGKGADEIVGCLRQRAARNHRSLQGELLTIIEAAAREAEPFDAHGLLGEIRNLGLKTPSESVQIIREDRDR